MRKYFILSDRNFANALQLLGFRYYKFNDDEGKLIYSFENTDNFQSAYRELSELKKKYKGGSQNGYRQINERNGSEELQANV